MRALIDLAAQDDDKQITLKSIAERQGISEHYLEQLIAPLKKAGIVKSIRGAQGGYILNKPADKITVGDIMRLLENSLYPVDCLSDKENVTCGTGNCDSCVTKPIWEKLYESMNEVMESISLMDLVMEYKGNTNTEKVME